MGETIGKNIKLLRKKVGRTQRSMAELAGINYRHYQEMESGRIDVKFSTVKALARVLHVPACYLYQEHIDVTLAKEDILCAVEIQENLPVGILTFDRDGRVIYSNRFFRKHLTHYSRQDLEEGKLHVWDLLHGSEEVRQQAQETFLAVRECAPDPSPAQWTYSGPNKAPIEVHIIWNYLRNHRGQITNYISVIVPISMIHHISAP